MISQHSLPDVDVLIIGAGPAGTSSAALLHQAGFKVRIIEKQHFPRFVIGESLLPRCMDLLEEAGFLEVLQQKNYITKHGALFYRGKESCSFDFSEQFTAGWSHTWQVPRADFDLALAENVQQRGVAIDFGSEVTDVHMGSQPTTTVLHENGTTETISSKHIIDASGYGRVLPRLLKLDRPSPFPPRKAIFSHLRGDQRPEGTEEGRIWVCIHEQDVWVWVIPFSNGLTSVGIVGNEEKIMSYGDTIESAYLELLKHESTLSDRLANVQLEWPVQEIKGYSSSVSQMYGEGYTLVGNATEFLDPVFSSGVTLALESANRGCKTLIRQLQGESVNWKVDYEDHMNIGIETFRTYVEAWYTGQLPELFFSTQQDPQFKSMICSVLAGYVWDNKNPFVKNPKRKLEQLLRLVSAEA